MVEVRHRASWARARCTAFGSLVFVAVLAASCDAPPSEGPREKITVALAMLPHASLVHVAVANGYFARAGLDVTIQPHPFGKPALDSVLAGQADLATVADTPIVLAILNGKPVSIIATIESASKNTYVLARKASAIAGPRDLAGKRVGRPAGTNAEFFLDTLLVRNEVERGTVDAVDIRLDEMSAALASGKVDAVAVWNPYSLQIGRRLGENLVTLFADDLYTETFNVVGRPDAVRGRSGAVERFLRGLVQADAFVRDHPEEARGRVASALAIDAADIVAIWAPFEFYVRLDQGLLVLLDDEARWAIRAGLAPKQPTPNFLEALAIQPLANAKPDAVRLIR